MGQTGAGSSVQTGVTLKAVTISPKNMALPELRRFDEARIAAPLGAPPMLMALPSDDSPLTYRNAEGDYDVH